MEAQVALAGSIAKSRTLTGPDGKEISMKEGPVVLPALDTFTRNFKWHGYFRAGTGFTANGVGQTFDFNTPDVSLWENIIVLATKTTSILKRARSGPHAWR